MRLKLHAVVVHLAEALEGKDLKPARVGEDGTGPGHEAVQPAQLGHRVLPGPHVQVVGIGEDYARTHRIEVEGRERAHRALRADRHERRCLDLAVGQHQRSGAGGAVAGLESVAECAHRIAIASP